MKNTFWPDLSTRASPDTTRITTPRVRLPATPKPVPPPRVALPGQPGQPVTLYGSVVLNPNDSSEVNLDALLNPTAYPLEVRELKWVISTPNAVYANNLFTGLTVDASLRLGPTGLDAAGAALFESLTASPVPLTLLGRALDSGAESAASATGGVATAHNVVPLDEPLYIPPGQGIAVRLGHRNIFPTALNVGFAVSGQLVARMPQRRSLPYWAAFVPPAITKVGSGATDLTRVTTERDLANLTGGPLRARRLLGRLGYYTPTVATPPLSDTGDGAFFAKLLQITSMRTSNGYAIVKDAMPFAAVFPSQFYSLEVPFTMPAKCYINMALKLTPMIDANTTVQIQPAVCLHGYRDFGGK